MIREIKKTADGSNTLYVPELNEHYHSIHGAVAESEHVYIQAGLKYTEPFFEEINLLEIGLGTGLNLYLTLQNAQKKVNYTAIEPYPLTIDLINNMAYGIVDAEMQTKIHTAESNQWHKLSENFSFHNVNKKLEEISLQPQFFNLVFFDAFAPAVQPELWTNFIFEKLYNAMQKDAVLVTYCCKGEVKRNLIKTGFFVEKLPGPPGKREMLRAIKK